MDILPDNNEVLSIDVCHPFFGNSCFAWSVLNRGETKSGSLLLPGSSFGGCNTGLVVKKKR